MSDFSVFKGFPAGLGTTKVATLGTHLVNLDQINTAIQAAVDGHIGQLDAARLSSNVNIDFSAGPVPITDSVQSAAGDRVFLYGQTDPIENGPWIVVDGSAWTRPADYATDAVIKAGVRIFVAEGTDHANHEYFLQSATDITVGTDGTTWGHSTTYTHDAANIDQSNAAHTYLTGATTQAQADQTDAQLVINAAAAAANADAIANLDVSGQIGTYYDGKKQVLANQTINASGWTEFTHELDDVDLSSIVIKDSGGDRVTESFIVEDLTASTFRVKNDTATVFTNMKFILRK
jgi:ribosomal protein L31